MEGFASEPIILSSAEKILQLEDYAEMSDLDYTNYTGAGFVEISTKMNRKIKIPIFLQKAGRYILDFRYSNGSGPWNTGNSCAIRSLKVNKNYCGVIVFPQRGTDEWSDWGYSNSVVIELNKGENTLSLQLDTFNKNMNGQINTAMLDTMRLRLIENLDNK